MVIDKTSQCGTEWAVRWQAWSRAERRETWRRGRTREREAEHWTAAPQIDQPGPRQGPESGDDPLVESGGHTPEEPSGERKQGGAWEWKGGGGGKRHGEVRATAWSELSAVGQLSALLSSQGFMSHTIYLAVKSRQPSHSPLSLVLPHRFYN